MLHIYVAPSSASSRKAVAWLKAYHIPFTVRNINLHPLNVNNIKHLFQLSTHGSDELISTRSKIYQKLVNKKHVNIGNLSLSYLMNLMVKYPDLLRRPILFNKKQMEVGYNKDDIRQFLPQSYKNAELHYLEKII